MNIIEALKNKDNNLRVSNGTKWLVWNDDEDEPQWVVYSRPHGTRKTRVEMATKYEAEAVNALVA